MKTNLIPTVGSLDEEVERAYCLIKTHSLFMRKGSLKILTLFHIKQNYQTDVIALVFLKSFNVGKHYVTS